MRWFNNEKGATMVEIVMILGILGALSVSIATLVNSMYDKYRVSRICGQIEEVKKVVNGRYVADGSYTGASASKLVSESIAPKDMVNGNALAHSYNGKVTISGTSTTYKISFYNLPTRACIELGLMNWMVDNTSDLVSLDINGKSFKWPWAAGTGKKLPAQMPDVSALCKSGSDNTVTWEFQ